MSFFTREIKPLYNSQNKVVIENTISQSKETFAVVTDGCPFIIIFMVTNDHANLPTLRCKFKR